MELTNEIKEELNLLVTIDHNYVDPLCVMLNSYKELHKNIYTTLYVVNSSLLEEDLEKIRKTVEGYNINVINQVVKERYFNNIEILERIPEESFLRLLAFKYLPTDVDKILYLDPDILIRKPLLELYNLDLTEYYLAAACHLHGFTNWISKVRLGLRGQKRYFNSGIMLMNIKNIRRDFTLDMILDALEEHKQMLIMGDQDLANVLFGKKTYFLDEAIYNLDEKTFSYKNKLENFKLQDVKEKTAIIHYNGRYKPWLTDYEGVLDKFYPEVKKAPYPKDISKRQAKSIYNILKPTKKQILFIITSLIVLVSLILVWVFLGKKLIIVIKDPAYFKEWISQFGVFDELIFIVIRSVQTMFKFLPSQLTEIVSGYAWGTHLGMLYCLIGNMLGTILTYVVVKKFGKKVIELFAPFLGHNSLKVFKESKQIYLLFFVLYLLPGFPKDAINYAIPFLPIKFLPFLILTTIARIPSIYLSTYCGATLADKQYIAALIIFVATILLIIIGAVVYKKYMKKRKQETELKEIHE